VRLGWSAGYLHLAVQVRDDLVADRPGDGVAEVDGVELYFDGRPDSARTAQYGPWVAQVILPAVRPVGERLEGNRGWPAGAFAWKVQGQVRGYDLEASVPHRMLQSEPTMAPGASVHFDFMVNDRDDSAQVASHHRLWSSESAASDPTGFGRIVLAE
jgi:hypothetical protein